MRLGIIIIGGLLTFVSVFCYANLGVTFMAIAFVAGLAMVVEGAVFVGAYRVFIRRMPHAHYILQEGIIAFVLGLCVLANRLDTDSIVPVFFGMWLLYSGITRTVTAWHLAQTDPLKKWMLLLGAASLLLGVYSMFNSMLLCFSTNTVVAWCFLLQGVNIISTGIEMPGSVKRSGQIGDETENDGPCEISDDGAGSCGNSGGKQAD